MNDGTMLANKMKLRNAYVTHKTRQGVVNSYFDDKPWLLVTPKVIRQQAAFEAAKNFKAAWSNKRAGNIDTFKMKFKSKRTKGYVLGIEKNVTFADDTLLIPCIGPVRFFEKPPIDHKPEAECTIQRDARGDFWLQVPVYRRVKPAQGAHTLAIDPGVRIPFSCYSPDGRQAYLEGLDMKERIDAIQGRVAAVDRRLAASTDASERRKLRRHRVALFKKYQNVRDDCHWKIIHQMTQQYSTILLPHLESSRLCGGLRAKSNRHMFGISHYLFQERMKQKCEEHSVRLVEADESYSSKTCGACGWQHATLGGNEVFRCGACGLRCHRDLHAARNIYLRWAAAS